LKDKTKIIIIYIMTFILIFSNAPIFNGTTIIELVLRTFNITTFFTQGDTGLYYPTIVMLFIGLIFWIYLRKIIPKSKFSKEYFYYCFGMMVVIAIINNGFIIYQ